jgi:hypothetical protein
MSPTYDSGQPPKWGYCGRAKCLKKGHGYNACVFTHQHAS